MSNHGTQRLRVYLKRHECRFGKDSLATEEFLSKRLCGNVLLSWGYLQKVIVAHLGIKGSYCQ
jgi:hypothetical protein